jgi:hypothetical protein
MEVIPRRRHGSGGGSIVRLVCLKNSHSGCSLVNNAVRNGLLSVCLQGLGANGAERNKSERCDLHRERTFGGLIRALGC